MKTEKIDTSAQNMARILRYDYTFSEKKKQTDSMDSNTSSNRQWLTIMCICIKIGRISLQRQTMPG